MNRLWIAIVCGALGVSAVGCAGEVGAPDPESTPDPKAETKDKDPKGEIKDPPKSPGAVKPLGAGTVNPRCPISSPGC